MLAALLWASGRSGVHERVGFAGNTVFKSRSHECEPNPASFSMGTDAEIGSCRLELVARDGPTRWWGGAVLVLAILFVTPAKT